VKINCASVLTLGVLLGVVLGCDEVPLGPDTTPPTATITSPSAGSTATDTIVVQVNATDDRGVAVVELYFDAAPALAAMSTAAPYRLVASLADLGPGAHTFRIVVKDSAGNTASDGPVAFTAVVNPGLKYVGRLIVDGSARDVAASGGYAYVASWDGGVIGVDVSNPAVPVTLWRYDTPGSVNGVAIAGSRLFVADGVEGIVSLSILDPANPVELARLKPSGINAYGIATAGNYAYVAGGTSGLYAVNISNPDSLVSEGIYDQGGDIRDVEISGNYAYTAETNQGMRVINIVRADSMYAVDQYTSSGLWIYDVSIATTYAYVACGDNGAQAVDISDPANITVPGFFAKLNVKGIVSSGNLTYFSTGANGVEVINSTDPSNLQPVTGGIFDTDGIAYKMAMHAGYLLVADNAQLTILKYVP